ncbi:DNA primase [Phycisphaera mikurensis]|uniref:DNA primase n=1 Tax=Phycisphaera mikurensis (strain NBRC 102666 / KCTC 22515 / FYK2301M01) TaxID=1142394 RepID=I0ICM2_PHYMF|nr:DNA primase [Phycisphaera mikurensis]MBB6442115.1 DNA primase [Phycisphaera mikurensis]BAM03010.1 DNA primase [Phycisphaera mikurensis NBRC 102666]
MNNDRERVLAATDLVALIGEFVALRPQGREFVGLCPFHDDKKPSMGVSPAKQIFKCFPCGAGGTAFDFVMRYHKLEFVEALEFLAQRSGVELTPWKPRTAGSLGSRSPRSADSAPEEEAAPRESPRRRLTRACGQAQAFFQAMLKHEVHGAAARAVLQARGISAESVERFGLGAAPDRWDGLERMVASKAWDAEAFAAAGLVRARDKSRRDAVDLSAGAPAAAAVADGGSFDMLRHRLVFPIADALGRPVAFGGRKIREEDDPKYLNTPESDVFHKQRTLYGLHLAKQKILETRTAVLVEGYTDVVACHQAGATNVVAALGTALTPGHAGVLRRFCDRVVLVMDGDAAGQSAADRAIETFLTADLDVALAALPDGLDPDELLKERGLDAWNRAVGSAQDALAWQLDKLAATLGGDATVTGRQKLAEAFLQRMADAGLAKASPLRRAFLHERLGELLHVPGDAIGGMIDRLPARAAAYEPAPEPDPGEYAMYVQGSEDREDEPPMPPEGWEEAGAATEQAATPAPVSPVRAPTLRAVRAAELGVLAALASRTALFDATLPGGTPVDEALTPADFVTPGHRRVFQVLFDRLCRGERPSLAGLVAGIDDPQDRGLLLEAEAAEGIGDADDASALAVLEQSATALIAHRRRAARRLDTARVLAELRDDPPADPADPATAQADAARLDRLEKLRLLMAEGQAPTRITRLRPSR